jgi:23S rRNA (adenine2503-C2)-methyltransferase
MYVCAPFAVLRLSVRCKKLTDFLLSLPFPQIVFMGEGEPLHNSRHVLRALDTILDSNGIDLSHNKVTVSSSGMVPEIEHFLKVSKANLAISLHAPNDDLRTWLMPINRKYPLEKLMNVLRNGYPRENSRQDKVFFQYLMLKGVNDDLESARELLRLVSDVPCKINLIHFNSHEGTEFVASPPATMLAFQDFLVNKGLTVTIRESRGDEKMMACGQLGSTRPAIVPRRKVPEKFREAVAKAAATAPKSKFPIRRVTSSDSEQQPGKPIAGGESRGRVSKARH